MSKSISNSSISIVILLILIFITAGCGSNDTNSKLPNQTIAQTSRQTFNADIGKQKMYNTDAPLVTDAIELKKYKGKRIRLNAIYHFPVKGCRYVKCDFMSFRITDNSFFHKDGSRLISVLKDGDNILLEARWSYYSGGAYLVKEDRPLVQEQSAPIKHIDGKYYVVRPSYYLIRNAILIKKNP